MRSNDIITGQAILREHGRPEQLKDNLGSRRLMGIAALIAVPENTSVQGEHQYIVSGTTDINLELIIHIDSGVDISKKWDIPCGSTYNKLFASSIWRI